MSWLLLRVLLSLTASKAQECDSQIILKADGDKPIYSKWVNIKTTLICPVSQYDWSIWYSRKAVYKQTIGCISDETSSLTLDAFPDVPLIKADFVSVSSQRRQRCIFKSSEGILTAIMLPDSTESDNIHSASNVIYYNSSQTMKINFVICNKGEVRNGTCLIHTKGGTMNGDHTTNVRMDNEYYKVTGVVSPEITEKYECVVNLNRTFYQFSVIPKSDVDECKESAKAGYKLCSNSECLDLNPGYRCRDEDYVNLELCDTYENWACPHKATYDYMQPGTCPTDGCIEAANNGVALCDMDVQDCITIDQSYRCKQGVPLLDVCHAHGAGHVPFETFNLSCPSLSTNTTELARFGRSMKTIAYNAKTLYMADPHALLKLTANLSDQAIDMELGKHADAERMLLAEQLLDAVALTLEADFSATIDVVAHSTEHPLISADGAEIVQPRSKKPSPVKPTDKVKSVSALLHMIAAIVRRTPVVRNMMDSGKADRGGVKFMAITPGSEAMQVNVSEGTVVELFVQSEKSEAGSEFIVAMVPEKQVNRQYEAIPTTDKDVKHETSKERAVIDSDVVLINSALANSTYQLTMNLPEQPANSLQCQQLRHSGNDPQQDWSSKSCQTVIVGLRYECHCTSEQTGTFAIALVYWIGGAEIPKEISPLIDLLNYVFIGITIVALFLFLLFSIFIGVFRLDQFNIAFCLLLSAILSLAVPHVSEEQVIRCTMVAIAVCFFPLAAFSWKFIFGLNTLLLVVSPRSAYHDWVAKKNHCVPLLWIGYMIPAVIVGAWFGFAENVVHSGRCIGPAYYRWAFIGPITAVVLFNLVVIVVVGALLLRSYLLTRKTRVTKTTHLLVLAQLMLTLGIPYVVIYLQFLDVNIMMIALPIAIALTAVLMFLLVAIIDQENRMRLVAFIRHHFSRSFGTTSKTLSTNNRSRPKTAEKPNGLVWFDRNHLDQTDENLISKQWICHDESAEEKPHFVKQHGPVPIVHETEHHDLPTYSNLFNTRVTFQPGWLHKTPEAGSNPPHCTNGNSISARNSSFDEFNDIQLRDAPIASMDAERLTVGSDFMSGANLHEPAIKPNGLKTEQSECRTLI